MASILNWKNLYVRCVINFVATWHVAGDETILKESVVSSFFFLFFFGHV